MKGIEEHGRAILTADVPEKGLMAGDVGTVVSVHDIEAGGLPAGYTLEFFSLSGETIALATVAAGYVRPARATDITHARSA
ncbi:MAG: DUF4926 domain-containing protein [Actinomycetota bacterium]|nr:DUF4926 domain-containing protein [Actinomycetota bacterium]